MTVTSALEANGWMHVPGVLAPGASAEAAAWLDAATASSRSLLRMQVEREATGRLRKLRRIYWADPPFWSAWVVRSGLADLVRTVIGPHPVLVKHSMFAKPPGAARVGYHQDRFLWDGDIEGAHTFWTPLDRADLTTGGLVMFSGTHRGPMLEHEPAEDHPWHPVVEPERHGLEGTALSVEVGDVVVHHARTLHGSPPNRSDRPRRAVAFTFAVEPAPGSPGTAKEGWVPLDAMT